MVGANGQPVKSRKRVNSMVEFLYPAGGKGNVFRRVKGVVIEKKKGPSGHLLTVLQADGKIRSFTVRKISGLQ